MCHLRTHNPPGATIDLNLLRTFATVADTLSFSRAATELKLPRSTVSRQIAQLESEAGVELVHRTTRRVSLSAAGAALRERVKPSLTALAGSLGELPDRQEEPAGTLRVTGPVGAGGLLLAEAIVRFTARYAAVTVDVCSTSRFIDLHREGFDLALRVGSKPLRDSSLIVRKLAPMTAALYASPSYLARRGTPRSDRELASHEWVLMKSSLRRLPHAGTSRLQCDDMYFVQAALRAGAGIGFLPSWLADPDVAAGTLVPLLPRLGQLTGHAYLVHPPSKHVPLRVTAFIEVVLETLRARG
jgi:DNA-binding transcriptional LysR family regulator